MVAALGVDETAGYLKARGSVVNDNLSLPPRSTNTITLDTHCRYMKLNTYNHAPVVDMPVRVGSAAQDPEKIVPISRVISTSRSG
jgi:hypothetical protein